MPNIGPVELIIILVIALLILGPGKLPDVGAAIGKSIKEFRKATTDVTDSVNAATTTPAAPAPVAPAPVAPAPAPAAAAPVAEAPARRRGCTGRRCTRTRRRGTCRAGRRSHGPAAGLTPARP